MCLFVLCRTQKEKEQKEKEKNQTPDDEEEESLQKARKWDEWKDGMWLSSFYETYVSSKREDLV